MKLRQLIDGKLKIEEAEALIGYAADELSRRGDMPALPRLDILKGLAGVRLETIERARERDRGEAPREPKHPLLVDKPELAITPLARIRIIDPERSVKPLAELLPAFHKERPVAPKTQDEHRVAVRMFDELFAVPKPVADITPQDVGTYKRALLAAPSRYSLRFPGKTLPEATEANKRRKEPFKTLDPATVRKKWLAHLKAILMWCESDKIIPDNPAAKVRVDTPNNSSGQSDREPFDAADLTKLFGPHFATDGTLGTNEWAMLILLFTGARSSSEVARLKLDDIHTVPGVLSFNLVEASKNKRSKRIVPVHDVLLDLGLMARVETLRRKAEERLFPEWTPEDKVNRWSFAPIVR